MAEPANTPPPLLFTSQGTDAVPDHPALLGGRCGSCGNVFFPMQSYGCERCGSLDVAEAALSGRGKLVASAEVHLHADRTRPAPFVVGSVVTDDGAVVRSVLDVPVGTRLEPGTIMVTTLVAETRPDRHERDLRFVPKRGDA